MAEIIYFGTNGQSGQSCDYCPEFSDCPANNDDN